MITHGQVIRNTGSHYEVRTDDGRIVPCRVKGNFRLRGIRSTNPVAVGDGVTITIPGNELAAGEAAFITEIDERRNYIIRKASNLSKQSHILAANIDQALLVVTIARPETSTTFIDRFLASAEAYRVPVILGFNKADDWQTDDERARAEELMALYEAIGYECFALSALQNTGIEALRERLCTRPRSANSSTCPTRQAVSSTYQASRASAPSIWKSRKCRTISAKSLPWPQIAVSPTAPIRASPDVQCLKP